MQTGSGTKNPPWARSNVNANMTGLNPQIMDPNAMMGQQSMMPFQQTQAVFNPNMMQAQAGLTMPMAGQMPMNQIAQTQMYPGNVVAYPTPRAMNSAMYQNSQGTQPANAEQRVFTGTVTKTHNDFGFVDHDVFYQTSVCAKGIVPKVNDRVLVEATYNPNMPFKWNATRVQVLPKTGPPQKQNTPKSNTYNAVPPPSGNKKNLPMRRDNRDSRDMRDDRERPPRRDDRLDRKRSRTRSPSRSRDRRDSRNRRDSPPRKRPVVHQPSPIKYVVRMPRMPLEIKQLDVPGLTQRYTNLYIPSDFFNASVKWGEVFPPQNPFSLNNPCSYHVMSKEVENPNQNDAVLEPPDADYRFSAKVMLISMPTLESLYQKCGLTKSEDKRSSKSPLHPTRLIKFLVGQKGKNGENFAIGGPWSPSLDGENPQNDPAVLVKTAIRTCKALTGIDLSSCTQWYRMVEFYYWRETSGGKWRVECVVLLVPDVWSAQPPRAAWPAAQELYRAAAEPAASDPSGLSGGSDLPADVQPELIQNTDVNESTITIDENDELNESKEEKIEPTHYSKLDLKTIKVEELKRELKARDASAKGLRSQLVSRLSKLIKAEQEKEKKPDDVMVVDDDEENVTNVPNEKPKETEPDKNDNKDNETKCNDQAKKEDKKEDTKPKTEKEIEEEKKKLDKERQALKARYELPSSPHIIVHPSNTAKGGKFNCSIVTLSLLLDYRMTDNKEHSFELFVFAELFNEMLMRDFGFYIYKTLYTLPEKPEEVKDSKSKDKSVEKGDKKDEKKDSEKKDEKKDDKDRKDDRRESRRRDRRDSRSDDEHSSSPRHRSRGVDLPSDPYLLLSLIYFDTSRNLSVVKKDLQNLFMSLGLHLSRSQIKNILDKVCIKDSFNYKTLAQAIKDIASGAPDAMQDLPLETTVSTEVPPQVAELEAVIATGNRDLLPIFNKPGVTNDDSAPSGETKDISDTGVVMYKSRLVDVGALVGGATASPRSRQARKYSIQL